jgi:peptidyl-prolyl cis-trans isomerase C
MLVAEKAEKDGLNKAGETQAMLDLTRLNVLQQAASQAFLKDRKTTDEELRAEYDSQLANVPKTEYHARHILVATEERAKKLISDLEKAAASKSWPRKNRWIRPRPTAAIWAGSRPTAWCRRFRQP